MSADESITNLPDAVAAAYVAPSPSCTRCYGADAARFVATGGVTSPCRVCGPSEAERLRAKESSDSSYAVALPWATLMDDEDLSDFLDELTDAATQNVSCVERLAEVERACGTWRLIAEAQHAHNTAPGSNAEESTDTLPAWLHWRFGKHGQRWADLDADDRAYWEHHARAVRRAVERGGFKAGGVEGELALGAGRDERPVNGFTAMFVPVASLREPEGEFYPFLHKGRVPHDLPETGGAGRG